MTSAGRETVLASVNRPAAISCWHIITCEYPPQNGGVSDYTYGVATGLAESGDEVHVWCPVGGAPAGSDGVTVHPQCGTFSPTDLARVGNELDRFRGPRRILVQWVPHGFGYRSMNLGFCWWLWQRRREKGDRVELMVHEIALPFTLASVGQNVGAFMHHLMTAVLLRAATRVWMSIPGWEPRLRACALGRRIGMQWLPIFSNIPPSNDPARELAIRRRYFHHGVLIGHFGTYGPLITDLLKPILLRLLSDPEPQAVLLMGEKSDRFREELVQQAPEIANLVFATGALPADEISHHLGACDLLIQPYPDGVTSRRTSFMAGLAHGKPMVTTAGHSTEPFWSECSDAVSLAPARETDAFVTHVRRLRNDITGRKRAGAAAYQLYQGRFDRSHVVTKLRQAGEPGQICAF